MDDTKLKPEEQAGLMAIYVACNGSTHAHVPIEFIRRKFSAPYKEEAKKIIEKLCRQPDRFIQVHKGRTTSYSITMIGIKKLRELGLIP